MPLYLDRHDGDPDNPFSAQDVIKAHELDQAIQDRYGVRYLTALVDIEKQNIYCVVDSPSIEAAEAVHREAHGLMAERLIEVDPTAVQSFLGKLDGLETESLSFGDSLRTILFTDIEESTQLHQRVGDAAAAMVRRRHDEIVRAALTSTRGREVKHLGDGIMACFSSVVRAIECSMAIQSGLAEPPETGADLRVRIGLSAGEPIAEGSDLFGSAVNLAKRICDLADPGAIVASNTVRELSLGKGFTWKDLGHHPLHGFDEPVLLQQLVVGS